MTCEQEGMTMQGSGNIQYQKTQFSGTFDLVISGAPEGAMSMQTKLSGRYIGQYITRNSVIQGLVDIVLFIIAQFPIVLQVLNAPELFQLIKLACLCSHHMQNLLAIVTGELDERKAENITTIDVIGKTSFTDYMVIATGTSERHIKALCNYVALTLKDKGVVPRGTEGAQGIVLFIIAQFPIVLQVLNAPELFQLIKLACLCSHHMQNNIA
jgi:ribosome-associated protein